MRINTKQTGDSLTAQEFNQLPYEVQNAITNAGLTPASTVLTQLSQAISQMVTDANFFSTSGTESNIILTANAPRLAPTRLTDGMMVRFRALYTNGANTTVNLNNLGAKNVQIDGENISAGEFEEGKTYILTYVQSTDTFELFQSGGGGAGSEIGDIGFAFLGIDESDNKRRYLNGQVIMQNEFEAFTLWVKEKIELYPNAVCSENEWQNEVQASVFHQCGKVVINDEDGTIRLPKVVNIQGCQDLATNLGVRLPESLPNVNGNFYAYPLNSAGAHDGSGAFYGTSLQNKDCSVIGSNNYRTLMTFDASRSSSTYQDNAPVQQEAIQYPFYIQVAKGGKKSIDATEEYTINNPFSLFDCQYDYKERQNSSWLLSNGQRNDGTLYASAYEELLRVYGTTEKKIGLANVKLVSDSSATDYDFKIDTSTQEFILPLKSKLASGKAVVGNGMTLGLTNGTNYAGLLTGANVSGSKLYLAESTLAYGNNIGQVYVATALNQDIGSGVTPDPTKSGIETDTTGLYLYYYVGDTVENPNLINAGQTFNALSKKMDINLGNSNCVTNCILEAPNGVGHTDTTKCYINAGVKVLFPNGRNADNTLKNFEYINKNEISTDLSIGSTTSKRRLVFLVSGGSIMHITELNVFYCHSYEQLPSIKPNTLSAMAYSYIQNMWYGSVNGSTTPNWQPILATPLYFYDEKQSYSTAPNTTSYLPVQLLHRGDKNEISGLGMPSTRYIDLTLGASGTTYTAPANGWFCVDKRSTGSGQYLEIVSESGMSQTLFSSATNQNLKLATPTIKGKKVGIGFGVAGTTNQFRFYYAEGEL